MNLKLPLFCLNRTGQNGVKNIFFCWSNKENRMQFHDKVYWIYKIYSHEKYFIDKVSMLHIYIWPTTASLELHCGLKRYGSSVWNTSSIGAYNLWGLLWWASLAKRKDHHGVSSGWSSTWFHSNTGLPSTQYEEIPIIFGVWPFWLTPFLADSLQ